jgi:predicted N-acetyltransferase YhbS
MRDAPILNIVIPAKTGIQYFLGIVALGPLAVPRAADTQQAGKRSVNLAAEFAKKLMN